MAGDIHLLQGEEGRRTYTFERCSGFEWRGDETVSGKTLQKAAADAGILKAYPKIMGNIESISRNGNSGVITNRAQIASGFGVRACLDKTVSATITSVNGQPVFVMIQGVAIGAGVGPLLGARRPRQRTATLYLKRVR